LYLDSGVRPVEGSAVGLDDRVEGGVGEDALRSDLARRARPTAPPIRGVRDRTSRFRVRSGRG
jgi:hypothetical protein